MKATIYNGDCLSVLKSLPDGTVNCCVTSPPYYGLRDYGVDGQIGVEDTPEAYVNRLVEVFREVRRVLRDDGVLWLNLGDSYAGNNSVASNNGRARFGNPREKVVNRISDGLKPKDLIGIPWMVAFALRADGWYLRQDIIWSKPNPMPESVTDRCTKSHEYIFLLSKSQKYYFDNEAIKEDAKYGGENGDKRAGKGRLAYEGKRSEDVSGKNGQQSFVSISEKKNKRSVWTVTTKPFKDAHFATFPADLIEPCVSAGCPVGGTVIDPFNGSATTGQVSLLQEKSYIGIELNPEYIEISKKKFDNVFGMLMPEVEFIKV